jgi:hypothetical protein
MYSIKDIEKTNSSFGNYRVKINVLFTVKVKSDGRTIQVHHFFMRKRGAQKFIKLVNEHLSNFDNIITRGAAGRIASDCKYL